LHRIHFCATNFFYVDRHFFIHKNKSVKGKRPNAKMTTFTPQKKTMSTQVIKLMDTMCTELEIELKEALSNREIQLSTYQTEGTDQNAVVGIKKGELSTTAQCKATVAELINANTRNTGEETSKLISDSQLAKWSDQITSVNAHTQPYREAYAKAHNDFQKRYNHLSSVRKLIHNMTAKVNQFYVQQHMNTKTATAATAAADTKVEDAVKTESLLEIGQPQEPRFAEMLNTIQTMMSHPEDPVKAANLDYGFDNATTGVREPLANQAHVDATLDALNDVKQKDPQHVDARGHLVKVGSDVGGYVYLVLTRISNTVADELSALKSSFQLQTATRKSVISQADRNVEKLNEIIQNGKDTNKAANKRLSELKKELVTLHLKKDGCKRDINDAMSSLEGSKHLADNLHMTLEELTQQLDRQIVDIKHELKLAKWARKLMNEKLNSIKKRVDNAKARVATKVVGEKAAEEPAEVVMDEKACLEGGPKDWCTSQTRMFHCGVTQASCEAYLAANDVGDTAWPGHGQDNALGEKDLPKGL
tara:strand:- start:242 stop:1840 length:1599 start_codon:yes stop_codon:yes gene_type:complete